MLKPSDLNQFTGSETFYRHWLGKFNYTEGVHHVAQEGGAYWLIDAIASYQHSPEIKEDRKLQEIQFWKLTVSEDKTAILTCERDQGDVALTQEIEYTDFPLAEVKFYLTNGVLLLPSEY
jgi:hypothetical protein